MSLVLDMLYFPFAAMGLLLGSPPLSPAHSLCAVWP